MLLLLIGDGGCWWCLVSNRISNEDWSQSGNNNNSNKPLIPFKVQWTGKWTWWWWRWLGKGWPLSEWSSQTSKWEYRASSLTDHTNHDVLVMMMPICWLHLILFCLFANSQQSRWQRNITWRRATRQLTCWNPSMPKDRPSRAIMSLPLRRSNSSQLVDRGIFNENRLSASIRPPSNQSPKHSAPNLRTWVGRLRWQPCKPNWSQVGYCSSRSSRWSSIACESIDSLSKITFNFTLNGYEFHDIAYLIWCPLRLGQLKCTQGLVNEGNAIFSFDWMAANNYDNNDSPSCTQEKGW